MLPGVNVIYLRTDHKLVPIFFFIINNRRERMYWEGRGKISKLKIHFSTRVNNSKTHKDSNILLMQPENLLYYLRSATRKINRRSLQSGSRNSKLLQCSPLLESIYRQQYHILHIVTPSILMCHLKHTCLTELFKFTEAVATPDLEVGFSRIV